MWKKKVRAGVLLYALFMAAVFSLVLQFYLNREVANQQNFLLNKERTIAYAMATLTKEQAKEKAGEGVFQQGKTSYQIKDKECLVESQLSSGRTYHFRFVLDKALEEKKEEVKEEKFKDTEKDKQNTQPAPPSPLPQEDQPKDSQKD